MGTPGIGQGQVQTDTGLFVALVVMSTVAFYNVVELFFLVLVSFRRYRGLYFWSLIVSSLGCFLHGLGFLLKFFEVTPLVNLSVSIITVGWYSMVTGQAVVLYSRLHLVELNAKLRRYILCIIIADAILFHIPTTVLTFGSNASPEVAGRFIPGYKIMEKIQMTCFCLQEFLISGVYLRATWRRLPGFHDEGRKKILMHLFAVNVIIIFMDLGLLSVEYANQYVIQVILKSAVYSIKLKLEFSILGQLVELVRPAGREYRSDASRDRARSVPNNVYPVSPMSPAGMAAAPKSEITKNVEVELSWLEEEGEASPRRASRSSGGVSSTNPLSPGTQKSRLSVAYSDPWSKPHAR